MTPHRVPSMRRNIPDSLPWLMMVPLQCENRNKCSTCTIWGWNLKRLSIGECVFIQYRVSPKKAERRIFSTLQSKSVIFCHKLLFSAYAVSFVDTDQWASPNHHLWKAFPDIILRSLVAKFENDCISRNGHRLKITQPHLMILVTIILFCGRCFI